MLQKIKKIRVINKQLETIVNNLKKYYERFRIVNDIPPNAPVIMQVPKLRVVFPDYHVRSNSIHSEEGFASEILYNMCCRFYGFPPSNIIVAPDSQSGLILEWLPHRPCYANSLLEYLMIYSSFALYLETSKYDGTYLDAVAELYNDGGLECALAQVLEKTEGHSINFVSEDDEDYANRDAFKICFSALYENMREATKEEQAKTKRRTKILLPKFFKQRFISVQTHDCIYWGDLKNIEEVIRHDAKFDKSN